MTVRFRAVICLGVLVLLYAFHVQLKLTKIQAHPSWSPTDPVGQFWSEFAVHYGFAKFFAEHPVADWGQLAADRTVQHPDPVNDWTEFALAMEVAAGLGYRLVGPAVPFHVWVVWFDCLVGSLAIVGVFLLALALWRNGFAALLAATFHTALYPSYGRTVKYLFLKEDFALPLILFALAASAAMLRGRHAPVWGQVGAALLWVAALASWHLTQFVLAVGIGAALALYLTDQQAEMPRRPWFVLTLLAGACLVPMLCAKQFWVSPAMCALYALGVALWSNGTRRRRLGVFGLGLALLLGASFWLGQSYGEYAHVYELFLAKLRFAGVKPEEPALLSWEARSLWEGAFETGLAGDFWRALGWTLPLAFVAVWRLDRRRAWTPERRLFVVFALLLVPLGWMVIRYLTFLAPIGAVLAAATVLETRAWKLGAAAAALWQLARLDYAPLDRAPVRPELYRPVVAWVAANTAPGAVILGSISESPVLWAHTGRAMVLHSKFENRAIRERYREFLAALYGSEAELHAFASRYGAEYFLYDVGCLLTGNNSWRYKADKLDELPATSPARLFAERPDDARHHHLEFAAERFRVYRVAREGVLR